MNSGQSTTAIEIEDIIQTIRANIYHSFSNRNSDSYLAIVYLPPWENNLPFTNCLISC